MIHTVPFTEVSAAANIPESLHTTAQGSRVGGWGQSIQGRWRRPEVHRVHPLSTTQPLGQPHVRVTSRQPFMHQVLLT